MKSARNQLILLGLISQALSWDDYFLPLISALLWAGALQLRLWRAPSGPAAGAASRTPLRAAPLLECALLAAGSVAAYLLAPVFGKSTHFFIGHGLGLLQLVRLLRPLNRREKIFSIIIAFFHIGVACTVILDYRFILLLGFALVLIPRAFWELECESFPRIVSGNVTGPQPALCRRLPWPVYPGIVAVMVAFFILFPRGFFPATLPPRLGTGGEQGTLADSILDPTRGGLQQSPRVLLHIQGERVGYLRCFALIDFDGVRWSRDAGAATRRIEYVPPSQISRYLHRRVRVKQVAFLGRVLPTDGRVVGLQGKFFRRPMQNVQGGTIECEAMWNTANNLYDYWINPKPVPEGLYPGLVERYTQHPAQSDRVQKWLDAVLEGITDPVEQARHLEKYFRANFVYKLGAPELNRLTHVEDFLFNRREGHCERFASTLALLLRMKGIPSRVMVGYLPNSRNWFSGWYSVRFSDAHAWTEAYFKDIGWIELDGTPAATASPRRFPVREMFETLDLIWYSNIVNFDAPAQQTLLTGSLQFFSHLAEDLSSPFVTGPALGLLLLVLWRNYRRQGAASRRKKFASARPDAVVAARYYGDMLRILASQGFRRHPQVTPLEFVRELQKQQFPSSEDAMLVTDFFCATRYGNHQLAPVHEAEIEEALKRLKAKG